MKKLQTAIIKNIYMRQQGEDMREGNSPSWFNAVEALQVMMYLKSLVNNTTHKLSCDDIGIITPYRKQVTFFSLP